MGGLIVVIGGGIVGTSIALHAADRGAPTVLVERDRAPDSASSSSFASLSALDEQSHDLYVLKTYALGAWRRWAKRLGPEAGVGWGGEIRWAQTTEAAHILNKKVEAARSRGYPVRLISNHELKQRLPAARPDPVRSASFAPDDGQVEPIKTITAARSAFQKAGGRLVHGKGKVVVNENTTEVRVGEETITASAVVLATGAESAHVTDKLGWEIPLRPSPGLLVTTTPAPPIAAETVYVASAAGPPIHIRQRSDGKVLIGEGSQETIAKEPTRRHAAELHRKAMEFFPPLRGTDIDHFTVEWRPMPSDSMPIIGPAPGLSSLYIAVMHSGVTLAPAVGELVVQELLEGRSVPRLEPFRPGRFAERAATVTLDLERAFGRATDVYLG